MDKLGPSQQIAPETLARAADTIQRAKSLVITAGAGMGVDSGLPDFRGDKGFWNAYPAYEKLGLNFYQMATPSHFLEDPAFAWGFYGHRANLYDQTVPHHGFSILLDWVNHFNLASFVVTSNVDGHFQKAGFPEDQIYEVHGSIHHMQCQKPCRPDVWRRKEQSFTIDMETMRSSTLPACLHCHQIARPNVLMFNDWSYVSTRGNVAHKQWQKFLHDCDRPIAVIEIGAGRAVPTIQWEGEKLAKMDAVTLIRVNPRDHQVAAPHISIPTGGAVALEQIDLFMRKQPTNS